MKNVPTMKNYIYCLSDPNTEEVVYIGKTKNIEKRYKDHCRKEYNYHKTNLSKWKNDIILSGNKPNITILDEFSEDIDYWEKFYISLFKSWNIKLLNMTDGGDGLQNPSDETRRKIGDKSRGRKMSESTKLSILKSTFNGGKKIVCYDIIGNFVGEFKNARRASETLSISYKNISTILTRKDGMKFNNKYTFFFKEDDNIISKLKSRIESSTKIGHYFYRIDIAGEKKIYNNIVTAAGENLINFRNIWLCLNNQRKTAGGYVWVYVHNYNEDSIKLFQKKKKGIKILARKNNEIIKFESLFDASKFFKMKTSTITKYIRESKTKDGYELVYDIECLIYRYMKIEKFNNYKSINEEFVGGLIKGALGKLAGMFSSPFKDLSNDLKKLFKEDDPNSLKSVLMTNINQAIDASQKEINNIQDDTSILGIMDSMTNTLIQLAQNIGKDIDTAFTKDKSASIKDLASALLLGNKAADWVGLVGLIDPDKGILKKDINYKYSKKNYVNEVNKGKDLKAKKMIANKFLDDMQKNLQAELDKDFTEEEVKKVFDESKGKTNDGSEMDYTKLKDFFDKKVAVIYLLKDKKKEEYNPKKKPEEQPNIVSVKVINSIDDKDRPDSVIFLDKYDKPTIKKSYSDIIGPVNTGENANKAKEVLGKIKDDEDKMGKVVKFAEFLQDDKNKNKVSEIEKMIGGSQ